MQPAPQGAVLGDWGLPQQTILQIKMQSVYHFALLAICCFLIFSPLPYYNLNKTLWPTLKDFLRKNLIFLERSSEHFLYALYLFGNSYIIKTIDCIGTEEQHGRDQRFYLDTGGILPLGWIGTASQPILRRWSYSRCVPVRARMCDPGGCGKAV